MPYQDTWVRGSLAQRGQRQCASRYGAIRCVLDGYSRRITVLDIGASEGYFSFRIGQDYDAVCVMVEGGTRLLPLCERNDAPRTILLQHHVTASELEQLATCEHFDVVLALNVLHHFVDWRRAAGAVLQLGDNVIIETPSPDDTGACNQAAVSGIHAFFKQRAGRLLTTTPSHVSDAQRPLWLFERPKSTISRAYLDVAATVPLGPVSITSTPHDKRVHFERKGQEREWLAGINLRTYQLLGGIYPSGQAVAKLVRRTTLPEVPHGDIQPWNFILDGEAVHLIDGRDGRGIYPDKESLHATAQAIHQGVAA